MLYRYQLLFTIGRVNNYFGKLLILPIVQKINSSYVALMDQTENILFFSCRINFNQIETHEFTYRRFKETFFFFWFNF